MNEQRSSALSRYSFASSYRWRLLFAPARSDNLRIRRSVLNEAGNSAERRANTGWFKPRHEADSASRILNLADQFGLMVLYRAANSPAISWQSVNLPC